MDHLIGDFCGTRLNPSVGCAASPGDEIEHRVTPAGKSFIAWRKIDIERVRNSRDVGRD
jgi:hypothetical protein